MPKSTSTSLFELIQSLTKAEKAYFTSFAQWKSREDHPLYIKLFDGILRQKQYDEKKIIAQFNVTPNVFSSLKNHLYSTLLDCLRNFHTGDEAAHKVREFIYHAEILFHKKLFTPCLKALDKALKIAEQFELLTYSLEITQFFQRVKETERDVPWLENTLPFLHHKEKQIIKKIENLRQFRKGRAGAVVYGFKIDHQGTTNSGFYFRDFVDLSLLKNKNKAFSFEAMLYYYHLNGLSYYYKSDLKNSLLCFIEMKKKLEESKKIKLLHANNYNSTIHNILAVGMGILSFEEIKKYFHLFKNTNHVWVKEDNGFMATYYNNLLRIYIYYHIRDKVLQVTNEVEDWLGKNEFRADTLNISSIIYFLSHIYFFNNNLKRSLYWLNNLLNNYSERVENYVYYSAKILILIINYELGNYDQIPYLAKSTYRFLQKRKQLFSFEKKILHFFSKKLPKASDQKKESILSFKELRKELVKEKTSDHHNRRILQYFDLISWIDSKIEGKPFMEMIKKKSGVFNEKNKLLTAES